VTASGGGHSLAPADDDRATRAATAQTRPATDLLASLGTGPEGLTSTEGAARQARYGPNELPRPRPRRLWRRFAGQFADLFAVVLLVAAAVTFAAYLLAHPRNVGNLQLAVAILAVVVLNAVIGFAQEYSAERTAATLQAMAPRTCRVVRAAERRDIPAGELVPGDLLVLEAGEAVPADAPVVEAFELTVNNAALTGESEPVARTADPIGMPGPTLGARNLVFMGTTVAAGAGTAVVYATGQATEFGHIFRLAEQAPRQQTPLQRQVAVMARRVAAIALVVGTLVFAIRVPTGQPVVASLVFALGVMVALVPEGLPATLSVSLAIGVRRMARRHALVKRLLAVEALGSTTVICTDKTGTLTQAEMTVTRLWSAGVGHPVTGVGYGPDGDVADARPVQELLRAAALCNDARLLQPSGRDGWRVVGDTTEGALLVAAGKAGIDVAAGQAAQPRVDDFPFDSTRKLMTTVHRSPDGFHAYAKGAPAELLARCTHLDSDGHRRPLTEQERATVLAANDVLAAGGLRVLAVAARPVPSPHPGQDDAESDLTLLGLVGMQDPLRPDVAEAVPARRHQDRHGHRRSSAHRRGNRAARRHRDRADARGGHRGPARHHGRRRVRPHPRHEPGAVVVPGQPRAQDAGGRGAAAARRGRGGDG
jgi:magnesium-transporting ATPase (P-type)